MKKKIIILAAVAVSGLAAVVANNTNVFSSNDAEGMPCEIIADAFHKYFCDGRSGSCTIPPERGTVPSVCTGQMSRIW